MVRTSGSGTNQIHLRSPFAAPASMGIFRRWQFTACAGRASNPGGPAPVASWPQPFAARLDSLPRAPSLMQPSSPPLVGVVMGSKSDYEHMQHCCGMLDDLQVPYEARVVSAHRTPDWMFEYAESAEGRGLMTIIAAAGGAAHLPGMLAAKTLVPVLGVPIPATLLNGQDALYSIVQMPAGVPVGTLAIGKPGAINAAILAAEIVGGRFPEVRERLRAWRNARRDDVLGQVLP